MYDKKLFLNPVHEENFLSLLYLDNTYPSDHERLALFFILSGVPYLSERARQFYDFRLHQLKDSPDKLIGPHMSSGIRSLLILGCNLYNGYHGCDTSPLRLFWNLDSENTLLALGALKIRFL